MKTIDTTSPTQPPDSTSEPTLILLVEDDEPLGHPIQGGLTEAGYRVIWAKTGNKALGTIRDAKPALVILDLGLPDMDGLEVLGRIRNEHPSLPVIAATARDTVPERIRGLESGADDYLVKPYAFEELLARIRSQLRRASQSSVRLHCADLSLDLKTRVATRNGKILELTPREFDLLVFLTSLNGKVASRHLLQQEVWKVKSRMSSMDNVIDVTISRLRHKLDDAGGPPLLHTIRGIGVKLGEKE